ncbi:MAG: NUDIX hydrolase [Candidatus Buchananbacteria bacterium]|nr:NUDIX hydrolase [Candidatus Buchananbacteria bacterium]
MSGIRAVGIVIKNSQVLLIHRLNEGSEYWVLPGGGVEPNETVEAAVVRELKEETSLDVSVDRLLYHARYDQTEDEGFYYLCTSTSTEVQLDPDAPESMTMLEGKQKFAPVWMPLEQVSEIILYPLEIRDQFLEDFKNNFSSVPQDILLKSY